MQQLLHYMKRLNDLIEMLLAYILAGMFLFLCLLVCLRYFFNTTIFGGNEIIEYLFIYLSSLGSAALIARREHIRVDLFPEASSRFHMILNLVEHSLVLILMLVIGIISFRWIGQVGSFPTPVLHIQQKWAQIAIPIGCLLSVIFSSYQILLTLIPAAEDTTV